jgi:hypothetical protein
LFQLLYLDKVQVALPTRLLSAVRMRSAGKRGFECAGKGLGKLAGTGSEVIHPSI